MGANGAHHARQILIAPRIVEMEAGDGIDQAGQPVEMRTKSRLVLDIENERMVQQRVHGLAGLQAPDLDIGGVAGPEHIGCSHRRRTITIDEVGAGHEPGLGGVVDSRRGARVQRPLPLSDEMSRCMAQIGITDIPSLKAAAPIYKRGTR